MVNSNFSDELIIRTGKSGTLLLCDTEDWFWAAHLKEESELVHLNLCEFR